MNFRELWQYINSFNENSIYKDCIRENGKEFGPNWYFYKVFCD